MVLPEPGMGADERCCCEFVCCGGLTVCALEVPVVAHTDGPIDVFKDLHTLDHKPLVRGGQGKMMLCPEFTSCVPDCDKQVAEHCASN